MEKTDISTEQVMLQTTSNSVNIFLVSYMFGWDTKNVTRG